MQKVHEAFGTCRKRISFRAILTSLFSHFRFQILFHSLGGVLFTFPLRYLFTIGLTEYLGFEGGPPEFNVRLLY